jgi:hypothetical protein
LTFKPVGILDDETYKEVKEMSESETVRDIIGGSMTAVHESLAEADVKETKAAAAATEEVIEKAKPKAEAKPAAKPKVEKKPEPEIVVDDLDIADIDFDD